MRSGNRAGTRRSRLGRSRENAAFEIAAKIELEAGTSSENTIDSIISSVESLDLDLPTRLDVFSDDL
jgi:hypothetical protein